MSNPSNAGNENGILPAGNTVWKIGLKYHPNYCTNERVLIELTVSEPGVVPVIARVTSRVGRSRKCRVPKAKIVSMTYLTGPLTGKNARNVATRNGCVYKRPGATVVPDKWDDNPNVTCTSGIHVYRTKREALRHL